MVIRSCGLIIHKPGRGADGADVVLAGEGDHGPVLAGRMVGPGAGAAEIRPVASTQVANHVHGALAGGAGNVETAIGVAVADDAVGHGAVEGPPVGGDEDGAGADGGGAGGLGRGECGHRTFPTLGTDSRAPFTLTS